MFNYFMNQYEWIVSLPCFFCINSAGFPDSSWLAYSPSRSDNFCNVEFCNEIMIAILHHTGCIILRLLLNVNISDNYIFYFARTRTVRIFILHYNPINIFIRHDSLSYSVLKLFTGFATAAFIAWKLTVSNVITIATSITTTKTSILIFVLYLIS